MKLFIRPKMQKPNTYRVPPRELQEGKEKKMQSKEAKCLRTLTKQGRKHAYLNDCRLPP